jgi:hypothetical protein
MVLAIHDPNPMTIAGTRAQVERFYALKSGLGGQAGGGAPARGDSVTSPTLVPPKKSKSV